MTVKQMQWAAQHDWCEAWDTFEGTVLVREIMPDHSVEYTTFSDYTALREWAGY